jgi:hypothetical protein
MRHSAKIWVGCLSVLIMGCSATGAMQPTPHLLNVAASARVVGVPDTVLVSMRVGNAGSDTQTVTWDDCLQTGAANALRVYAPGSRALVWDWFPAFAEARCDLISYSQTLQPGDSVVIVGRVAVADILGDSLPPGLYDVTLTPKYLQPSYPTEVPLGQLALGP